MQHTYENTNAHHKDMVVIPQSTKSKLRDFILKEDDEVEHQLEEDTTPDRAY